MKTKESVKVLVIFIISIVFIFSVNVAISLATSKSELNNQKSEIKNQINETNNEIKEVQEELSGALVEIQNLMTQIDTYENEIQDLDVEIEEISSNIDSAQKDLEKTEKDLEEKQDLLDKRLVALYEAGSTTYIDVLLNSDGLTDFISNYYLIEELAEYDTELIDSIKVTKDEIEKTKISLENSKAELEATRKKQETKKNALAVVKNEKSQKAEKLNNEEKELEKQLEQYQAEQKSIDAQLAKLAAEEKKKQEQAKAKAKASGNSNSGSSSSSGSINPSASGYIRPVSGYSVTTGWYYSNGSVHGAVDFSGSGIYGKPVVAVKDGTVWLTGELTYSYGNYVIINHHDGTFTLYAHGIPGSICVSQGQSVKQGQQLMQVGSSGNSSGPHLHFEVRTGDGSFRYRVNPLSYLP